jgi:hypothetical protein
MKLNKSQTKYWFKQFSQQKLLEKSTHEKKYIIETINGLKVKKSKPIIFMDMMIKDYLELNFFNWKYIKENHTDFVYETPALKENIDESDF